MNNYVMFGVSLYTMVAQQRCKRVRSSAASEVHDRMLEDSVETVDIAPTIADILGIQLDGVDGRVLELGESN